jgi:protein phosphatase
MVEAAFISHPGKVRTENEDYAYHGATPHGYVGLVCDGMGGHAAGEVAARLAAEAAFQYLIAASPQIESTTLLEKAFQAAQARLMEIATQHAAYQNFGTTLVIALLRGRDLYYAHVGDSRAYLHERGTLTPLTEDDSLVQQLLKEGLITAEQAIHHPQKHVLSQCLGPNQTPTPHVGHRKVHPHATILLCTDGLSNALSQEEMAQLLSQTPNLSQAAELLVNQANRQGGYDNITVLLLKPPPKSPTFALPMKLPPTKYLLAGGIGLIVVILLALVLSRRSQTPTSEDGVIVMTDSGTTSAGMDTLPSESVLEPPPPTPVEPPIASPVPSVQPPQPPAEKPSKPTPSSTSASPSPRTTSLDITVQKGDNLTQIAKAFHISREAILKANDLRSDQIRAGQRLSIPVKGIKTHTVQKGENLSKLAREYHSSIEAIRRSNGLSDKDEIKAGQKLKIPILK